MGNLKANLSFIEEDGEMGDNNIFENTTEYSFDNFIQLSSKPEEMKNRLEYYDLIYE